MPTDRQRPPLRKVAILVASLDQPLAQRLLADLPAQEAETVRAAAAALGPIDPEEQQVVIEDFFRNKPRPEIYPRQGVELDPALLARLQNQPADNPRASIGGEKLARMADADSIVESIRNEHPQTIAVVLSQLQTDVAAEVLSALPATLQADALGRLAELDAADEQTMAVVESQLSDWIGERKSRQERLAAGRKLVNQILQCSPPAQQTAILGRLRKHRPALAESFAPREPKVTAAKPNRLPQQAVELQAAIDEVRSTQTEPLITPAATPTVSAPIEPSSDLLAEMDQSEDSVLLAAICQADQQTVSLALVGASDQTLKRILRRLPRRQAREFRRQLRAIGPTSLGDMHQAQQEFVTLIRRLQAEQQTTLS